MSNTSRLEIFQANYKQAESAKTDIQAQIDRNISLYHGDVKYTTMDGRSNIVMKDIKRAVEGLLPQLIEPFVSTQEAILAEPKTYAGVNGAKLQEAVLNEEFNALDKDSFIELLARTLVVEGTVFLKAGWSKDRATGFVCENDSIYTDPSAKTLADSQFLIYKRRVSKSIIKDNEQWYGKGAYEKVRKLDIENTTTSTSEVKKDLHGYESSFNFDLDDMRSMVTTYEYYGYDMDGKPVLAIWVDDTMLRDEISPFPTPIPFSCKQYMLNPHSIWGDGLPQLIEDHQLVRSKVMNGILDNMSMANNGQKYIKKGTMDYTNWKRMKNGDRYIQVNKLPSESIEEGSFNPIAPSTFQVLEMFQLDEETLTGVTRFTQGNDPRALNSTARGISMLSSMANQRALHTTRIISSVIKDMVKIWAEFNMEFLQPTQIVRIQNKWFPCMRDEMRADVKVDITVGTAGVNEAKTQSILTMTQLAAGGSPIPEEAVVEMMASLAEINNLPNVAQIIRQEAVQELTPQEQEQQSLAAEEEKAIQTAIMTTNLKTEEAKQAKDLAKANLDMKKAEDISFDNQMKFLETVS